jgi:hypothetical protein
MVDGSTLSFITSGEGAKHTSPGNSCGAVVPVDDDDTGSVVQLGATVAASVKPRIGKTNAKRRVRRRGEGREAEVVMAASLSHDEIAHQAAARRLPCTLGTSAIFTVLAAMMAVSR